MAEPDSLILEHLRHIRGQLDRIELRLDDLTRRVGRIETDVAQIHVTLAEHSVGFDRLDMRVTRIGKPLDLVEG